MNKLMIRFVRCNEHNEVINISVVLNTKVKSKKWFLLRKINWHCFELVLMRYVIKSKSCKEKKRGEFLNL